MNKTIELLKNHHDTLVEILEQRENNHLSNLKAIENYKDELEQTKKAIEILYAESEELTND